ncbi:MAG TPA: CPBP family glutamic-type intramembrane protease [Actinomycetota bacterium]
MIAEPRTSTRAPRWAAFVAGAGLAALALRAPGVEALVVVAALGVAGLTLPVPARDRPARARAWLAAVAIGALAMALVARAATVPLAFAPLPVGAAVLAAVAEEAFFRRFLYGWLAARGPAVAISLTAAAFALVHLPVYGEASLPLNVAAGALLGWQRWATGTWSAPAATHALANVLAYA